MNTLRKIKLIKEFGWKIMLSDFCASNIRLPRITSRCKDRVLLEWLKKNYACVISKYQNYQNEINAHNLNTDTSPIWTMWWQGEENAPDIVRMCFMRMRKYSGSHPVRIITKDNFADYITLPDYIFTKVRDKSISFTHLSDIMRMYLLSHYGGLWLDSTVLVTEHIPEDIFAYEYYTVRQEFNPDSFSVAQSRWSTPLQVSVKGGLLCSFVYDMLLEYCMNQNMFVDYVLMDYCIALAYETFTECRRLIDSVPHNNFNFENMHPLLNSQWSQDKYDSLREGTIFFKLTFKRDFKELIHGHETFYAHLIHSRDI